MILLWLAGAFIAGDVVGAYLPGCPVGWIELGSILAGLVAVPTPRRLRFALILGCGAAAGLVLSPHIGPPSRTDAARFLGRPIDATGSVSAEPDVRDRTVTYTIALSSRHLGTQTFPLDGYIEVRTSAAVVLPYGEVVEMRGTLHAIPGPARNALLLRGISGEIAYPRIADLGSGGASDWHGSLANLRLRIENGIDRWLPEPDAALLIAISLGARSSSLGDLAHPLTVTGLIHLVAISGIKVSLFAGMAYQLVRRAGRRYITCVVSLGLLWSYVAVTGFTASGTRSAIMWTLVFLAVALGRGTVALVSLSIAVALMVAYTPGLPWDTGFEMSALGTFFIVAFAGPLTHITRAIPSPFGEALSVTAAAQLGTLPVVIAGFHVASSTGPLANALVLPLVPALMLLGFVVGLCADVALIAAPLAATAHILCAAIGWVATFGAAHSPPYAATSLPSLVTALYYGALTCIALRVLRLHRWDPSGRYNRLAPQFALAGLVAVGGLSAYLARAQSDDMIAPLGTGEAVLVQGRGQTMLIDGSPRPFNLLEALGRALPLNRLAIDAVVVTDPRSSNVLGLRAVAARYRIGEVLDVGSQYPDSTYAQWREELRASGVPVYALRTGATVNAADARLTAIAPDAVCAIATNCAGMVRITTAGRSYLIAGAASRREQLEAVFRPVHLRSDVLMIASPLASSDFQAAVHPATIVRLNSKR